MAHQARPRGTNVCPNHIVYTLIHIVSPPSLCSCVTSLTFFGDLPLFFLFCLSCFSLLFCLVPLPPFYVYILSRQLVNRFELLSSVGNRQQKSSAVCGRHTLSYSFYSCKGLWSCCCPFLLTFCHQKPLLHLSITDISVLSLLDLYRWQNRLRGCKKKFEN